jgi:ethanolamine utilization protein EutQ (cupin superfamily)
MESKQKYLGENKTIYIGVAPSVKEGLLSIVPNKKIRESIYDAVRESDFSDMEVEDEKLLSFLMKGDSYETDEYFGIVAVKTRKSRIILDDLKEIDVDTFLDTLNSGQAL